MAAYLRQQTHSQISQSEAFLSLGLFDKTNLQIVPERTIICTSSLQVFHLQIEFTNDFASDYKCICE
jgi:hypothetical protein